MAKKKIDLREKLVIAIIRRVAYVLFWLAVAVGGLVWLVTFSKLVSVFGIGIGILGSLTALVGWLGGVAGAGILVMLVEIQRSLEGRK